jgi:glycosyltransferase involved in cell wall biosynthesis
VKILFVAHDAPDGIGAHSAGLRRAIPSALGPEDEFVVRSLTGRQGGRATRIVEQQLLLPFAERDADLVHLPDFRTSPLDRHQVLLTVHDVCFLDRPEWFPRSVRVYKSALLRVAAASRPAVIVCVSEYTRERLLHHLPRLGSRVHVIRPGIDEPDEIAAEPTGAESYFLTISTIEPRKNHLGLLAAFQEARREGLELRWKVAGTVGYNGGPIAAALSAADGVDVIGRVTDDERERLFRKAAFVAVPSFIEGFGIPAGEAMARGVPVVVATGSGLDEVGAGTAALRLDPGDVGGWTEALRRLEDDLGLRRELRRQGLEAAAGLHWSTAAGSYVELYRGLLG